MDKVSDQNPAGQNSSNRKSKNSLWYYDSPGFFEKALQMVAGICKFTQSDCTTLTYGNARIACASLTRIEKGFFNNKLGTGLLSDLGTNFITSVSKQRVDYIQGITQTILATCKDELNYYKQLEGTIVTTDVGKITYSRRT